MTGQTTLPTPLVTWLRRTMNRPLANPQMTGVRSNSGLAAELSRGGSISFGAVSSDSIPDELQDLLRAAIVCAGHTIFNGLQDCHALEIEHARARLNRRCHFLRNQMGRYAKVAIRILDRDAIHDRCTVPFPRRSHVLNKLL